ncbi:hypothetical protein [Haloarchaeobius litoreus]|uniref:Sec-independent protein translocase protein TatA n=1 Tax=Haloarchaeobius litoreus TaxID=755306 RepID=A0ABD6DMH5_9EURY|nr:hypothetical protein [Haloarchaeobius litoreus]
MIPLQTLGLPELLVLLLIIVVPLTILAAIVVVGLYLYNQRPSGSATAMETQTGDEPTDVDEPTTR